ncbi:CoA transferase [Clostridia bacterium]|nr:CoA transferase [Clostridia bacterium]
MQALEGIRVLDLSRLLPGPYCSMTLADFGAEVIKIESPGEGDYAREFSPIHECGMGYFFLMLNRNKKSVSLDLKNTDDLETFLALAKTADVVIDGFRPGITDRLGIGYSALSELNPRLIYCAITAFGQNGPYSQVAGHDLNLMSLAGATNLIGSPDGPPAISGVQTADLSSAMNAVNGILLAILAREKTGRGQFIDIAMYDSVLAMLPADANIYFCNGETTKRGGSWLTGQLPNYSIFETKDRRYISLGAVEKKFWARICETIGRDDLIETFGDPKRREDVFRLLSDIFKSRTMAEWVMAFEKADACFSPVLELDEAFNHPQALAREMIVEFDDPRIGKHMHTGMPIKLSDTPGTIRSAAPKLGEHNREILSPLLKELNNV